MNLNTLFALNVIIALITGIGFTLIPEIVLSFYGVAIDSTRIMFARLLGGEFLSYSVLTWFARNLTESGGKSYSSRLSD